MIINGRSNKEKKLDDNNNKNDLYLLSCKTTIVDYYLNQLKGSDNNIIEN